MTDQNKSPITLEELLIKSGLNEDVLVEILLRLDTRELLKICDFDSETDKTFINLIEKRVVPKKIIDMDAVEKFYLKEKWNASRIFRTFGKSMTKLKITISFVTFYYLMNWIVRFCNPNKLKYMHLIVELGFNICYDFETLEKMRPFLKDMKMRLECENIFQKNELKHVLNYFHHDLNEISMLTIDGHQLFKYCSEKIAISPNKFENITELRLSNVNLEMYVHRLFLYLRKLPNVEKFVYIQYNPQIIASVGREILECIPNLKSFGFVTHRFHCSDEMELNSDFNIAESFAFLSKFRNLLELEIGADFNCRYVARLLRYTRNIKTFSMYQIEFMSKIASEIQQIVQEIILIISRRSDKSRINMIVNTQQYNQFQKIKRVEIFMNFQIKNRIRQFIQYDI